MASDTGMGKVRFFDDFLTDTLDTFNWTLREDSSGSAIVEAENGVYKLYGDGSDGDIQALQGAEIWQPNTAGTIVFEARCKFETSITTGAFIGLSDDNDADQIPADIDGGTLATDAEDVVGFIYDSDEGSNWYVITSKASADGAQTDTTVGPTISTYQTFRITVQSNGDCRFFIDGKEITASGAARTSAITTTVQFCPVVAQLDSGTAADIYIDYVYVSAGRA